ncbi:MAG: glycogen/starch synthase [Candidatus Izemoplasma sp.]
MNRLFAIIDATTKNNLDVLTMHRMPGALPFGGKYRLIDFVLSNLKNSSVRNVAIFPYGNYRSLTDHIGSGKRWNLDRKRDGLFVLPPKNLTISQNEMITFQRMYEHLEYFKRSSQEYVVITQANIVWNINFQDALKDHIKSEADITEIIFENTRLKTFILSRKLLIKYIENYDSLQYRTILDLVERANKLTINMFSHDGYTRTITDPFNYLKSNLDILNMETGFNIFRQDRPIVSKEKVSPPAKYLNHASVKNSMVSAGAIIDGTILNSIIGRDVIVRKGAVVKNSYIMNNSVISENAEVNYCILDKRTLVKASSKITGTQKIPYLSEKEQIITTNQELRILIVASEAYPFIKTGGLADVIGGLSRNLVRQGVDTTVILPLYHKVKVNFGTSLTREFDKIITYDNKQLTATIFSYLYHKVKYYFIEYDPFFKRDNVYGYEDDADRFAFFNKAVVSLMDEFPRFNIVHLHDWHTSLIPLLIDDSPHMGTKTLLTIHNIGYQGIASSDILKKLNVKNYLFQNNNINFLEIGINTATKISTVSPTYKEELRYEYYGKNLTSCLIKRERDFYGILNGISQTHNPEIDPLIFKNYSINDVMEKYENKLWLQKNMGIGLGVDKFVIGMVTRIVEHKGFDLILETFEELLKNDKIQFVLLGAGDKKYIEKLDQLAKRYPNQVKMNFGYDSTVPNYIYSGADLFLMPSRFEPCGLGQMIALRYGTLPLVRRTGGLNDSIFKYDSYTKKGNGFTFNNYDPSEMLQTINDAYNLFSTNKEDWKILMRRAMISDNSLIKSTNKYIELYINIKEN